MNFKQKISRSLSFKLMIPVLSIGLFVLVLILSLELFRFVRVVEGLIENETEFVTESLILASEANSRPENIQRVVLNLASKTNVRRLTIINGRSNKIIGDSKLQNNNGVVTEILSDYEQDLIKQHSQLTNNITTRRKANLVTRVLTIQLIDMEILRLRPHWVLLTLDRTTAVQTARQDLITVVITFLGGFLSILVGIYWAHQKILIKPLLRYENVVRQQDDSEGLSIIHHKRKDELGTLADAYNKMVVDNQQRRIELNDRAAELSIAKEDAEEASRAKSSFLASMSHEIRTPLNGVLGMIRILQKTGLTSQQQHKLSLAKNSGESLQVLINDILDFSKIEAGKLEFEHREFDLRGMLGSVAEAMALRAQEKELELILNICDVGESIVVGDVMRLRQVITNLLGNAIKFTSKGEIEIIAKLTPDVQGLSFRCEIRDTGIGIPVEKQAMLFESFRQVDASTTRQYGGTGLGLAISKRLCELMGGTILIESEQSKGSNFIATATLDCSSDSVTVKPLLHNQAIRLILLSPNRTLLAAMKAQLKCWHIDASPATTLVEYQSILDKFKDVKTTIDGVLVDDALFVNNDISNYQQFVASTPSVCKKILMCLIAQSIDEQSLKNTGFDFAFPKPVTTSDYFDCLEVIVHGHDHAVEISSKTRALKSSKPGPTVSLPPAKILIVEDNKINQEVVVGMLEHRQIVPHVVTNGLEALDKLTKSNIEYPYDLILMDCQMPLMDGYETTRRIRNGEAGKIYKQIPIVALTANAMSEDKHKCLAAGMSDYLTKPIEPESLYQALSGWLINGEKTMRHAGSSLAKESPTAITWDKTSALKRVRNKEERLTVLANMFLNEMPGRISELSLAIKHHEIDIVGAVAHAIKGSAGNLSAYSTMEAASELEMVCKSQQIDQLENKFELLYQNYAEVETILRSYVQ